MSAMSHATHSPDAPKKELGRRIVKARERAGLNQRQLAERLVGRFSPALQRGGGQYQRAVVSMQRSLRRYENGHNEPRGELLMAIATETDTDPRHFTENADEDEEESVLRRVAGELVVLGRDDLAADLQRLAARKGTF